MKSTHKIKIHYINSPIFTVGEEKYSMQSRMLRDFADIDTIIDQKISRAEKEGYEIEMAIMNITNMHFDEPIKAVTGEFIPFLRYRFFKSTGELPQPYTGKIS
jgi:hypothetical protein